MRSRPKIGDIPPEHCIFDPADLLDPNGFKSGWMLSGTVAAWKQATGTDDTAAASWYVSAKQLLYEACLKARLLEGTGARMYWSQHTYNPIGVILPEPPECPSGDWSGDHLCDDCYGDDWFDPGSPKTLHASELYRLCDTLFPKRPDGWMQLAWNLRIVGDAARVIDRLPPPGPETLMERWQETLPQMGTLRCEQQNHTLSGWQVACRLADAMVLDARATDEECALLAHLAGEEAAKVGQMLATRRHGDMGRQLQTFPQQLLEQLDVVRAALS